MPSVTPVRCLCVIVFATLAFCSDLQGTQAADSNPRGKLTFEVVDYFGLRMQYDLANLVLRSSQINYASSCMGLVCEALPYGVYTYRFKRRGFTNEESAQISGTVRVDHSDRAIQIVTEGLIVKSGDSEAAILVDRPAGFTLNGTLHPFKDTSERIWVRMVGVYNGNVMSAVVNSNGNFFITDCTPGLYAVTVTRGQAILALQPVLVKRCVPKGRLDLQSSETLPSLVVGQ